MFRTTLLAFTTLFLSVALVANEPTNELETAVLEIMNTAFCVSDYDTVETLFDKLSLDGKKNFLQIASKLAAGEAVPGRFFDLSLLDGTFLQRNRRWQDARKNAVTTDECLELDESFASIVDEYLPEKVKQTQLLGRLTLSFFEQSAVEKPQEAYHIAKPAVVQQRSGKIVRVYYVDDLLDMTSEEKSEKKEDGWHFKSVIDIITKVIEPDS